MPDTHRSPQLVASAKDALAVMREAVIVVLFLLLVVWPTGFNSVLERAGFTKGSLMGFEWEKKIKASSEQAKSAGDAITQMQERLQALLGRLASASGPDAAALKAQLQELLDASKKAEDATKKNLATQQDLISEATRAPAETVGWMYLGKTSTARDKWGGDQTTDAQSPSELRRGSTVHLRQDVWLRSDDAPDPKKLGRTVGALRRDDSVILQGDPSYHDRGNFIAVWARVKKL